MDQSELALKYEKVKNWLESFDEDEIIPEYEVNEETIMYLYGLCEQNKEMNNLSNLLIDDINVKSEEYKIEASRLREMVEGVGLPIYALSNAGKSSLKMLSQLASVLDIKDLKKSTFMLALKDFSNELSFVMEEVAQKQADINIQISEAKSILKNLDNISVFYEKFHEHSALDLPFTEKRKKDIEKMNTKSNSYMKQLNEDEQTNCTVDKQLHHASLVRVSEELKVLKEELKPLQVKYDNFRCLPPDILMAKVKIEETKRYMEKLDRELQEDIDYLRL